MHACGQKINTDSFSRKIHEIRMLWKRLQCTLCICGYAVSGNVPVQIPQTCLLKVGHNFPMISLTSAELKKQIIKEIMAQKLAAQSRN